MYKRNFSISLVCFKKGLLLQSLDFTIFQNKADKYSILDTAACIVDYLLLNSKTLSTNRFVISLKEFSSTLNKNTHLITYGLTLLKNAGVISITRKGIINGTNSIILNEEKLEEIENNGRHILKEEILEREKINKENLEKDKIKIRDNQARMVWDKERTLAINKMAYSSYEDIEKDTYNTRLYLPERFLISYISKGWYRFTGKIIRWDYKMFLTIRKIVAERNFDKKEKESFYRSLSTNCNPQKLIDIVKFATSIWFKPLTESNSCAIEMIFKDAYNKGFEKLVPFIYKNEKGIADKTYESLYPFNMNSYLELPSEDTEYYKQPVSKVLAVLNKEIKEEELRKNRLKRNPFNDIDPNDRDYRITHIVALINNKSLKEKLFEDYKNLHKIEEKQKEKDYYSFPSNSKEDPLAKFR